MKEPGIVIGKEDLRLAVELREETEGFVEATSGPGSWAELRLDRP